MQEEPPPRGRRPRRKRTTAAAASDPTGHWTPERIAAAPGAAYPGTAPLRQAAPEQPRLLDTAAGVPPGPPPGDRPAFWLAHVAEQDHAAVRRGLLLLLAAALGPDAGDPVVDAGRCEECGVPHGCSAVGSRSGDRRVYFGSAAMGGAVVHALGRTPVGVGLARCDGSEEEAAHRARAAARRAAWQQAAPRGRCGPRGRTGEDVTHDLAYIAVPDHLRAAAVWQRPGDTAPE
ncbi:hypothetical protein [Streptomyces peucetius]|uniref:4Fe-4S Wbl-type domain-containing protein n=1 Tax=Streptomyces peucetius TaxID=1950 RepID=A0ABY6IAQ9_STRPE|nr:hypothetical protein [Streptomyces peucetius]UYQ64091.1 hypothetical protein OGH68_23235 [Streptomyces peucetius]